MTIPPKQKPKIDDSQAVDGSTWADDQAGREYYYDDAHGYEPYIPDEDEFAEEVPEREKAVDDGPFE